MSLTPLHVDVPLRFADLDALGHVNNVAFVSLIQEARARAFLTWDAPDAGTWSYVVARQEIEHREVLEYRLAPIRVEIWPTRVGGSSIDVAGVVRDRPGDGETVYATARTVVVHVDPATGRPARLNPRFAADLEGSLREPPARR